MKIETLILILIVPWLFVSCHKPKDKSNETPVSVTSDTIYDKFIIEMDINHRLSKVTHLNKYNSVIFIKSYEYSNNYVLVKSDGTIANYAGMITDYDNTLSTYFLNQDGLADSCQIGVSTIYYHYDQNNYLISFGLGSILIEYLNGNKIKVDQTNYQFTEFPNLIDYENFEGTYLGKLNQNLIYTVENQPMTRSTDNITTYNYTLDASGLVQSRIGIKVYKYLHPTPITVTVTKYSYIINK